MSMRVLGLALIVVGTLSFSKTAHATAYIVQEQDVLFQNSSSAPTNVSGNYDGFPSGDNDPGPYSFHVQSQNANYSSVTGPNGTYSITYVPDDSDYKYTSATYATASSLEAVFDGSYTFNPSGGSPSETVSLTGDAFPNVPQITLVNGIAAVWNSLGQLVLNPDITNTLTWTAFSGSFANGGESVDIYGNTDIDETAHGFASETPFDTLTIDAGSLTPGSTAFGQIVYTMGSAPLNPSPGNYYAADYAVENDFTIDAVPEPAQYGFLIALGAAGFIMWRRLSRVPLDGVVS